MPEVPILMPQLGESIAEATIIRLNVKVGDPVEMFGDNIPIESVSDAADTIPYELITRVHQRVTRRII